MKQFLETGEVVSTHGVRGEIKVYPWADGPEFLLNFDELRSHADPEPSAAVKKRVEAARSLQRDRFAGSRCHCNANMQTPELRRYCDLSDECAVLMRQAFDALGLTARSYDRIRKVARTIADLDGSAEILPQHLAEAIQYRTYQFTQV